MDSAVNELPSRDYRSPQAEWELLEFFPWRRYEAEMDRTHRRTNKVFIETLFRQTVPQLLSEV